jgi:predicted DNA binding CopG/RHH family protein
MRSYGMKAEEFDAKFDSGQDMTEFLDFSTARRPNREPKTIELTLPAWLINQLETEANKQGISAQTFLENYLTQHLPPTA